MKKILFLLLVVIVFLVNTNAAFAWGRKVGKVKAVNFVSRQYDEGEPYLEYDVQFVTPEDNYHFINHYTLWVKENHAEDWGLRELLRYAMENQELYDCYIGNGDYQSSGGSQQVIYAQLLPAVTPIKNDIRGIKDDLRRVWEKIRYILSYIRRQMY